MHFDKRIGPGSPTSGKEYNMSTLAEYRKMPHWSTSSLATFVNCSLQYAFRYVYHLAPEHNPVAPLLGRSFHKAATWMAAKRKKGEAFNPAVAEDFFSESFLVECKSAGEISFGDGESESSLDWQGRSLIACLCESWPDEQVLETATAFCVPLISYGGIRLSEKPIIGELDLLVRNAEGKTAIVDWKSAARKWPADKADKELQATVYLYSFCAERRVRLDDVGFRFDVLTKTKVPSYMQYHTTRKYDDLHRLLWLVQSIEKAIKAESFIPNQNSFCCSDCVYGSACEEWHRRQSKTISFAKAS